MMGMEPKDFKSVSIIGACGHIGLPLALVLADAGFEVTGIDLDANRIEEIMSGHMPYVEEGAEELLARLLPTGRLRFSTDHSSVNKSDVLMIIIGTPIDDNLNARIDPLLDLLRQLKGLLRPGQLVVLRSTVSPGTTELFKAELEDGTDLKEGKDITLVFAPERVLQTKAITEIADLPQLIGAFSDEGFETASRFFRKFVKSHLLKLSPVEAELGKLMTNMARYVSFALANEFYLIADSFGANAHKIINACNLDYDRLNIPKPGPNVGGPCLFKDGYYLLSNISFPEIISTAFKVNESMPMIIAKKIFEQHKAQNVGVLGLAFKPNCDDTRSSLSFKLRKLLRNRRCKTVDVDPYVEGCEDLSRLKGVDALVLMTPHREFASLAEILKAVDNPDCLIVDLWNYWPENIDLSHDGVYRAKDVRPA